MGDNSFITHFDVSASGLTAERMRMRTVANNIANVHTTRTAEGGPYRRQFVVLEEMKTSSPLETGVRVKEIVVDSSPPRFVFDPDHPDADERGYVALPNVDVLQEAATMKTATMAYQANVSVVNSTKQIISHAIDIAK